jgi:hypothetical protein
MLKVLDLYSNLQHDAAALIVAFSLASWFAECFPLAPLLYLLGPDNEAALALRLMGCFCRRAILLCDVDIAALGTLPRDLCPTLLVNQRDLGRRLTRVLFAANNRHFAIARGKDEIHAYGAKAFASVPEFADGAGVRVSLSPTGCLGRSAIRNIGHNSPSSAASFAPIKLSLIWRNLRAILG